MRVDAPPPAEADRAACQELVDDLPASLADLPRRRVEPADPAGAEWAAAWGEPAIVLTCGSEPPAGFDELSSCTTVNDVDWFIPEEQLDVESPVDLTMTTVHRRPYVQVLLPAEHFPPAATLADLSGPVERHLRRTGGCV